MARGREREREKTNLNINNIEEAGISKKIENNEEEEMKNKMEKQKITQDIDLMKKAKTRIQKNKLAAKEIQKHMRKRLNTT